MFKRIDFSSWETLLLVGFFITFGAFVYFTWRALRMRKEDREHMANLPLEPESKKVPGADDDDDSPSRPS